MSPHQSPYRILVVEDDPGIRQALTDAFERRGYKVLSAGEGNLGMTLALQEYYDLALLDIVLPGYSGLDILAAINNDRAGTPVIMLTAKGAEEDRIKGLEKGADDYIVKPFSIRELIARMEAVLRRSPERPLIQAEFAVPEGVLNATERCIIRNNHEVISLSTREYELLHYFLTHPDRIISKEELLRRVWHLDPKAVETRSVEMTLTRLREKIGQNIASSLQTLRGQGYRWSYVHS